MEGREKKLRDRLPRKAIKEISEIAGVSLAVVSGVVNQKIWIAWKDGRVVRRCSEETERRILKLAEEYARVYEKKFRDKLNSLQTMDC